MFNSFASPYKKGNREELQKKSLPHNINNPKKGFNIMIIKDVKKYFKEILDRYWLTTRAGKTAILNHIESDTKKLGSQQLTQIRYLKSISQLKQINGMKHYPDF